MPRKMKKLTPKQVEELETLAAVLTCEQMADYFGLGRTVFFEILKRQPEVDERYKKGRNKAIADVGNNLIMKAINGDTTAQIFFLKTRAGWREKDTQYVPEIPKVTINFVDA